MLTYRAYFQIRRSADVEAATRRLAEVIADELGVTNDELRIRSSVQTRGGRAAIEADLLGRYEPGEIMEILRDISARIEGDRNLVDRVNEYQATITEGMKMRGMATVDLRVERELAE